MTRKKDKVFILGLLGRSMMENGKKESNMGKEL